MKITLQVERMVRQSKAFVVEVPDDFDVSSEEAVDELAVSIVNEEDREDGWEFEESDTDDCLHEAWEAGNQDADYKATPDRFGYKVEKLI